MNLFLTQSPQMGAAKAYLLRQALSVAAKKADHTPVSYTHLDVYKRQSLACGVHPLDLEEEPYDADRLLRLSQDKKVIAIGEIGLDYYYSA